MRMVGANATMRQQYPPRARPYTHSRTQPLVLNPLLDPTCEMCQLPLEAPGWYDYSPRGYYGTHVASGWVASGRFGPAVQYTGGASRTTFGVGAGALFVAGQWTWELWARVDAWVNFRALAGFQVNANNRLSFLGWNDGTVHAWANSGGLGQINIVGVPCAVGAWYHYVWACDVAAQIAYYFINGAFIGQDLAFLLPAIAAQPYSIADESNAGIGMPCTVDEHRVYSRILAADEILALYEQGRPSW